MMRRMAGRTPWPAPGISLKAAIVAGLALLVGVNAITLGLAAWNRSGDPEAVIVLSERELDRPWDWRGRSKENSGLALKLRWRVAPYVARDNEKKAEAADADIEALNDSVESWAYGGNAHWLDTAKLRSLGFVLDEDASNRDTERSRSVLLVLEINGPAYAAAIDRARQHLARETVLRDANPGKAEFVQRAKRASERLADQETEASRLFIVDAGLDAAALRARYPDRSRYAIAGGRVRPGWVDVRHKEARRGHIERLDADTVNVPHALRAAVPPNAARRGVTAGAKNDDRFTAEIAFGKRLEPWIRTVLRPDGVLRSTAQ